MWRKNKGAREPLSFFYFPLFSEKDLLKRKRRWWWPMVVDGSPSFLWSQKSRRESLLYIGPTYTTTFVLLVRERNPPSQLLHRWRKLVFSKRVLFSAWKNISNFGYCRYVSNMRDGSPPPPSVRPSVPVCWLLKYYL